MTARFNVQWIFAALKNGFRDATAYQTEFLLEVFGSAFTPAAVQWIMWYAMFKIGGATEIAGMRYSDMIQYTLVSLLFTQIRGGDQDFELSEMIRTGGLSNYLLRPVSVIQFVYVRGIAPKLLLAAICLALGTGVGVFYGLSPIRLVVGMFLAILGNIIHYQISAALAAAAFLWEESFALLMVKNMVVSLLSGEMIPLSFFPSSMEWLWKYSPFYLYVFAPVQISTGKWGWSEMGFHFMIAVFWILFGWALIRASWGYGIRKYVSLGS